MFTIIFSFADQENLMILFRYSHEPLCHQDRYPVEKNFLSGVFSHFTSEACEKSSRRLWKKVVLVLV